MNDVENNKAVNKSVSGQGGGAPGVRMYVGALLLALAFLVPLCGFWVATWSLSVAAKTLIIGALTVGVPEVLSIVAIALLGNEALEHIKSRAKRFFADMTPQASPSTNLRQTASHRI